MNWLPSSKKAAEFIIPVIFTLTILNTSYFTLWYFGYFGSNTSDSSNLVSQTTEQITEALPVVTINYSPAMKDKIELIQNLLKTNFSTSIHETEIEVTAANRLEYEICIIFPLLILIPYSMFSYLYRSVFTHPSNSELESMMESLVQLVEYRQNRNKPRHKYRRASY